jgi:hypothetical protein
MGTSDLTSPTLPYRTQLRGLLVLDMSAKPWGRRSPLREYPGHRDKHQEGCGCWEEDVGHDEVHKDVIERRYDGWEVVAGGDGSQAEGNRCGRVRDKVELFSSTY